MWEELLFYLAIFLGVRYALMILIQTIASRAVASIRVNPKEIHPMQFEREGMWPIGLVIDGIFVVIFALIGVVTFTPGPFFLSLVVMILAHAFVVEPIYYLYHRILHLPWFYRHHHIYHHKSIVVEPITSMSFTLTERLSYTILFSIPALIVYFLGIFDFKALIAYYVIFDFLNAFGHLNIKLESKKYKDSKIFKWLIYSPEYHEKHHSLFTSNYALFMPIWDRLFKTYEESKEE